MATKAAVLKVRSISSERRRPRLNIAAAVLGWFREGQLGSSSMTEASRYTGARI